MGIFNLLSKVIDCKIVDIPPNPITKLQAIICQFPLKKLDMSRQPLVISIKPLITHEIEDGNRFVKGEMDVITTKKIAMITPTDIMLIAESRIIEDKSCF